jgi:drug/metabolite transporter (DMT)-like permease
VTPDPQKVHLAGEASLISGPLPQVAPSQVAPSQKGQHGALLLTVAAILFSLMALCAKAASQHLAGPQIAWLRFVVGIVAVALPLLRGYRMQPQSYRALLLRGLFGSFAVLTYFLAIAHLPVGIATLLNSSSPLFVALFSFLFLREALHRRTLVALLITAIGVALVVLGNAQSGAGALPSHSIGWALVGLLSAVLAGAAVTTVRSMRQTEGSWEIYLAFCCVGSLTMAAPGYLTWVPPTAADLAWVVAMGLCSAIAQVAMTHALRDVRAVTAALILQITPVATLILGMLLFAERPSPLGLLGATITLLGVSWGTIARSEPRVFRQNSAGDPTRAA